MVLITKKGMGIIENLYRFLKFTQGWIKQDATADRALAFREILGHQLGIKAFISLNKSPAK